jgi:hypothetical protein
LRRCGDAVIRYPHDDCVRHVGKTPPGKLQHVHSDAEVRILPPGDNWRCVVLLEAIAPASPRVVYPRLVECARRGPPEDVSGPWGYGEFLEAIADPKHERQAELLEWSGGELDPVAGAAAVSP